MFYKFFSHHRSEEEYLGGIWMLLGFLGLVFGLLMGLLSLSVQKKNREYRDALIHLSERFPVPEDNEPDETAHRRERQSAQPPHIRKTAEEEIAD